jgi:hypothetical protein
MRTRHGIRLAIAATTAAALLLGSMAAWAAEPPAPAGLGTVAWKIESGNARGLVALTQEGDQFSLNFQFIGLKPDHAYRLLGHTSPCSATTGKAFHRNFTTDANGFVWDPVVFDGSAGAVQSVRVRDLATGKVACADTPAIPLTINADVSKVRRAGVRGLVVVAEGATLRVLGSMTGLDINQAHRLIERQDDCTTQGALLFNVGFSSDATGAAFFDRQPPLPVSGDPLAGASLRLREVGGTQVFCRPFPTP